MNIIYLEYLTAVARTGSLSRAAKELFVSQPYLSGVVKSVEEELELQIFQRTNTGMDPTGLGAEFLAGAERILIEWRRLQGLKERRGSQLQVVSYYSPFFTRCFLELRSGPGATPQDSFQELTLTGCLRALAEKSANLALICYADCARAYYEKLAASYHCRCGSLFRAPLQVMMRQGHPLADRTSLRVGELRDYPFVCFPDSLSLLRLMGLDDHPDLMQVADRGTYYDAARDGNYLSIIAVVAPGEPVKQDLRYVPLEDPGFSLEFAYAVRESHQLNDRERTFLRLIRTRQAGGGKGA